MDASDRLVWRYAQENQMMILTANRNMKGEDSLEQVKSTSICRNGRDNRPYQISADRPKHQLHPSLAPHLLHQMN